MVDIEADGPQVGRHSMISFGAVDCRSLQNFYGECKPIFKDYVPEALAVSGFTREQTLNFREPSLTMNEFAKWLDSISGGDRVGFISDNNGFDWQFINWYFLEFVGKNPFGHSSTNLGSLYKGLKRSSSANFKKLRKTKHTHYPVDDAMGNVEALKAMIAMGLKGYD